MNDKFLSFLGITKKSGNLFLGMDNVKNNITCKNISLILTAKNISKSSFKKINNIASKNKIKIIHLKYTIEDINSAIGKFVAIIGISQENFISKLINLIEENHLQLNNQEELYGKKI